MAKNDNIQDFVVDIANAIREKKGTTELINPQNFSDEILSIASSSGEDMLQLLVNEKPDCTRLFRKYNGTSLDFISNLDTSNVTIMDYMFEDSKSITTIPKLNTQNVTSMNNMFYGCSSLETIPLLNTEKVTNMGSMFNGCQKLTSVPLLNTESVTSMSSMFSSCSLLTTIPQLNTTKVTDMGSMFSSCKALSSLPELNTENVTKMERMFTYCNLKEIPLLNTKKVTNMSSMFYYSGVETIPLLDMEKVTNVSRMFDYCSQITNVTLKNIKVSLTLSSGSSYGTNLTLESLINTLKELWDYSSSSSTYTLTIGDANISKLADVYVRLIDVTDEMIAQDPNIASKMPCEVCNSTDEGAMPIITYANNKGWTIA